jgi:integrase
MRLPRSALQIEKDGPVLVFPSKDQKRGSAPVVPISKETCELLQKHLLTHDKELMFPLELVQPERWLYRIVKQAAQDAGIATRVYPHLFRHMRALEYRRRGADEDTVLNSLGWRDSAMYNTRYGRRNPFETAQEARKYLPKPEQPPEPKHDTIPEIINKLADLLKENKIDPQTYHASLAALQLQQQEKTKVLGYQ